MKILYAIQGTGNGHLSRAQDIIPVLKNKGHLDILVSGTQTDLPLPYSITYRLEGLSFVFGKKGGVDLWKTYRKSNLRKFLREIRNLPIEQYDLVINDFEPVSAWAALSKGRKCIALSHQAAVLSPEAPKPAHKDWIGKFVLKNYAPANTCYGFHFGNFSPEIHTPVIRKQIREASVLDRGHYTVYLPSYSDERLVKILSNFPKIQWQIFSKHNKKTIRIQNIWIRPIDNEEFVASMATSTGVLCGAGFETPAEALFLRKKLMVIPMKNQYEQHCNAAALKSLGVPVLENLKEKDLCHIASWLSSRSTLQVNYPDNTKTIIDALIQTHLLSKQPLVESAPLETQTSLNLDL